ncbi:MAG: dephospho-CoA kinase [Frankiales bacterium]|jgi:dephospho-CoA kinase|nr:dephospho-CoA kinase [Frankiales bacterium]
MYWVGLTGGIGAGKSTVARLLADRGAAVIDADLLAREVVEPGTDGLAEVVAAFGPEVLAEDGTLDRKALAARVFADPEQLARLNAIVHPRVEALTQERASRLPPHSVVVNDIPLLVEVGAAGRYDLVVVVEAPEAVRIERLRSSRGMAEADAKARIASQAGPGTRTAVADVVIDNAGSYDELAATVDDLWARIRAGR